VYVSKGGEVEYVYMIRVMLSGKIQRRGGIDAEEGRRRVSSTPERDEKRVVLFLYSILS
jgi:hypothetical protein